MTENKEATDKSGKREMHLRIVSAEKRIFSGQVAGVHVRGALGELGILPGHSPLLTTIPSGNVAYTTLEGDRKIVFVSGGVLEVQPKSVTILADTAMRGEDIEESKALEAKREAEARLLRQREKLRKCLQMQLRTRGILRLCLSCPELSLS